MSQKSIYSIGSLRWVFRHSEKYFFVIAFIVNCIKARFNMYDYRDIPMLDCEDEYMECWILEMLKVRLRIYGNHVMNWINMLVLELRKLVMPVMMVKQEYCIIRVERKYLIGVVMELEIWNGIGEILR